MKEQYIRQIKRVREQKPLIHHITNYVTVNDCANITLAIGASPIMADAIEEAADIAAVSSAVVLNMGTLNERTAAAMIVAGQAANKKGIPVIFDPVGAGASSFRNVTAERILKEVTIAVLRGNISEIRFLAGLQSETKGVDASEQDSNSKETAEEVAGNLSRQQNAVVAITGAIDVISDGTRYICVKNGHPMMANLTGTGCMCSSLVGSFCGANPETMLEATAAAVATMGIAGELAWEHAGQDGNGSFRCALHDAVSQMDGILFEERGTCYETKH